MWHYKSSNTIRCIDWRPGHSIVASESFTEVLPGWEFLVGYHKKSTMASMTTALMGTVFAAAYLDAKLYISKDLKYTFRLLWQSRSWHKAGAFHPIWPSR